MVHRGSVLSERERRTRCGMRDMLREQHGVGFMAREKIILGCTECKNRNYFTMKNKRLHPERVEWKKYCPRCNSHKTHKETK